MSLLPRHRCVLSDPDGSLRFHRLNEKGLVNFSSQVWRERTDAGSTYRLAYDDKTRAIVRQYLKMTSNDLVILSVIDSIKVGL